MNNIALVMPGPTDWIVICGLVVFVFGAKKLPEFARGWGEAIREFRKGKEELNKAID